MWLNATETCSVYLATVYAVQVYLFLKHIDIHDALERPTILDWDGSNNLFAFWSACFLSVVNLFVAVLNMYSFADLSSVLANNGTFGVIGWVVGFLYLISIVSSSMDELQSYNVGTEGVIKGRRNLRFAREPVCKRSIGLPVSVYFLSAGNWFLVLITTALHLFLAAYIHSEENALADLRVDDFVFIPEADVVVDTAVPDRTTHDCWTEMVCGFLAYPVVDIQG